MPITGDMVLRKIIQFFQTDLWRIRVKDRSRPEAWAINFLRVILTAGRRFGDDRSSLMASALTFYSLLSIVPVLAAAFGVAKGFGFEKVLEQRLLHSFSEQREVFEQAIGFAQAMLERTQGGIIAGVGVVFLLWSVSRLLMYIEGSFNTIWRISRSRSFGRMFSDYLAMIVVAPLIFVTSGSLTVFIATWLESIQNAGPEVLPIGPVVQMMIRTLPYILIWALFCFTYIFIPNTKVSIPAGIVAGIVAGTSYQLVQWVYIKFQIGVSNYGAIYGSFAALPLFLIWLQTSWLIVLAGAQVCSAMQNLRDYEFRNDCELISAEFRMLLSLLIAEAHVSDFSNGRPARTNMDISQQLEIPIRLTRELTDDLVEADVLVPVETDHADVKGYAPARDIADLRVCDVVRALRQYGPASIPVRRTAAYNSLQQSLYTFAQENGDSLANQRLRELSS